MSMKKFYEKVKEALQFEPKSCNAFIMVGIEGNVVSVNYFEHPFMHFSNLDWSMYEDAVKVADVKYNNDVYIYLKK